MAKLKSYTKEHLDAHIAIQKEKREVRQRIKTLPQKASKTKKVKADEPVKEPEVQE